MRLASVSPRLLEVYADDGMTLDQLTAFSVSTDHERQEQVWEAAQRSHSKEPYQLRRLLTEGAVRAADKRAQFVGVAAYEEAGGIVMRDFFAHDDGGWLQDPALLDRLVAGKLEHAADTIRAEGWKWVEVATDFPYGHTYGLRHLAGEPVALTEEETATIEALEAEYDRLEATHAEAEEMPEDADQRLGEIETALEDLRNRPIAYDPAEIARAGAFVSIDGSGVLRIERGYVRPEDEAPTVASDEDEETDQPSSPDTGHDEDDREIDQDGEITEPAEEDEGPRPIPDRLMTELTAHRTLALRDALANDPDTAFLAVLHVLCLKLFYHYGSDSCLEIEPKSVVFGQQAPGLADTPSAKAVEARHETWARQFPREPGDLWSTLASFDTDSRHALFAHCVGLTVNAVYESWNRRPKTLAHADRLAEALSLDMVRAGWTPTADNYFDRVTKARILGAVREARGEAAAQRIEHLKKAAMAVRAEKLLAGTGWLPEPLRTPGYAIAVIAPADPEMTESGVESATDGGASAIDDGDPAAETEEPPAEAHVIAAE